MNLDVMILKEPVTNSKSTSVLLPVDDDASSRSTNTVVLDFVVGS